MAKKWLIPAKMLLSGLLIYWLLRKVGLLRIGAEITAADGLWFAGALILFLVSHLLGALQWRLLLRREGIHLSWLRILGVYFVGLFFNNFLISSMGGDVFRMIDIHKASGQKAAAVSTVFLDRFAGLFVMFSLAIFSWPWLMARQAAGPRMQLLMILLVAGWALAIAVLFSKRAAKPLAYVLRRLLPDRLTQPMREIYGQIHAFGRGGRSVLWVLILALAVQTARIMTHYLLARAVNVSLSPLVFFVLVPIIALVSSLPVSFGGLGIRENMGVLLFAKVGVTASAAFSIEFLIYIVAILTALPGGLVFAWRRGHQGDAVQAAVQEVES